MYLRTTARTNKDGSVVRYLALAHNQRVGAATKANVLLNLGREDRLDPDGLRRLVRSINRYLGEPDTDGTDAAAATGTDTAADGLRLITSRPAGAAWLLHGLGETLSLCGRHDVRRAARALRPARRALRLYRDVVAGDPSKENALRWIVDGLAKALERVGHHAEAVDVQMRRGV